MPLFRNDRGKAPPRDKWDVHHRLHGANALRTRPARSWMRERQLGAENRGGLNGGVWVVKDRRTNTSYIEKCATEAFVRDGTIFQEIIILKYLSAPSHEHITRMVDYFVDRRLCKASIYLERCSLGGLETLIETRYQSGALFNESEVWEWFIQLFDALTYCDYGPDPEARFANRRPSEWANGWDMVFHRDIKVENVLVHEARPRGMRTGYTLKIADFGCAVARRHIWTDTGHDRTRSSGCDPRWTTPEYPRFMGRSDVWQLGGVMGCICNLMTAPFFDRAMPAPGYSSALNRAIAESMRSNSRQRPKADAVLSHVKEQFRAKAEVLEQDPRPVPRMLDGERKWVRRRQLEQGKKRVRDDLMRREQRHFAAGPAFNFPGEAPGSWGADGFEFCMWE